MPKDEKTRDKIRNYISLGLNALLIATAIASFFVPIANVAGLPLTPFRLVFSGANGELQFAGYAVPETAYALYKYFYLAFALAVLGAFFLTLFQVVTRRKNEGVGAAAFTIMTFLTVSLTAGMNFVNIYKAIDAGLSAYTPAYICFAAGLVLTALKAALGLFFRKKVEKEELKESKGSVSVSFVLTFLAMGALFVPLYAFPATGQRMSGLDILLGRDDALSFLPASEVYKILVWVFTGVVGVSFAANIILFILERGIFVRYNKVHNVLTLTSLVWYALAGLNYMLVYEGAKAHNALFDTALYSYAYAPLALSAIFYLGYLFTKVANSKLIEYEVFTDPGDIAKEVAPESAAAPAFAPDFPPPNGGWGNGGGFAPPDGGAVLDPVPAFSELDRRAEGYGAENERRAARAFTGVTLPKLVDHVIEYARNSADGLIYGEPEIRTFVAGLAAGKMAILQGMSGTGKTSLPKIFMESIDGVCDLVAVESSWRDKNELLGYYNDFTKKYTPKSFTQFLYKASLNREAPCFIVLDEMNLSRIEYYFSDFLSLMEERENARHIKLFDVQLYPREGGRERYLGLRDGHTVEIPPNVWFIGTANRDESTFEISDKVYDRALTMNFDRRAPKPDAKGAAIPPKYVSYATLRALFDEAVGAAAFDAEGYGAIRRVEALLLPYRISFGNRIVRQIETFVKVYAACCGETSADGRALNVREAVDRILLPKVVRKLELKQLDAPDALAGEFAKLDLPKCAEFLRSLAE
ncbi:MAG: AAA family ATPase [Clostridiales bacterium]|jgi:hypothetical protein|nr:AAA family ATPase [Clostridiales bacterium]